MIDRCVPEEKLFLNTYGVDLSMFIPADYNVEKKYDVIYAGTWSKQKGSDLFSQVIQQLPDLKFAHVGTIGDVPIPKLPNFEHVDPVDQTELPRFYQASRTFLHTSRQDGFSMVLSQAMACNLPIVASYASGASNLKKMVDYPEYVQVYDSPTIEELCAGIRKAIQQQKELTFHYGGTAVKNLSWEAYGKRYADFLLKITG